MKRYLYRRMMMPRVQRVVLIAAASAIMAMRCEAGSVAVAFNPFYDGVANGYQHVSSADLAAVANVPASAGQVYNASGNSSAIVVLNFSTVVYTGPIDVTSTLNRIRNNQSVYPSEQDDGCFFNFKPTELPNIPRMGMNYYMEFTVWPLMNLSAGTYDSLDTPYNTSSQSSGDTYPGPERMLIGSAGEVYYTGDHYSTSNYVNPITPLPAITVNSWNTSSSSWSTAANWTGGHVPAAGEAAYLSVADEASRTVTYDYTGSAVTLGDFLVNADGTSSAAGVMLFQQSQGTLTTAKEEVWARLATAAVNQSGGNDKVNGTLHIGQFLGSAGTYNLSGGTLATTTEYIGSTELVAAAGTGTFNQTGGTHNVSGAINLGFAAGGTGTYLLKAGALNAATINVNAGGTFNVTGGTLSVTGIFTNSNSTVLSGAQYWSSGSALNNLAGLTTFNSDAGANGQNLAVNLSGGSVLFTTTQHLFSLSIANGFTGKVTGLGNGNRSVLFTGSLSVTGKLDLTGNDLDVQSSTSLTAVNALVKSGYNNGTWTGNGIISSAASADTTRLTALGVIQNNQNGTAIYIAPRSFDGATPGATDVLVKYTYFGDCDLSGSVTGSDYSRIDFAYLADRTTPTAYTGWFNGDFNYDGAVNGSDYTLMDNAFNRQGAQLTAEIASPTAQIAETVPVPEPAAVTLFCLSTIALLGRRKTRVC